MFRERHFIAPTTSIRLSFFENLSRVGILRRLPGSLGGSRRTQRRTIERDVDDLLATAGDGDKLLIDHDRLAIFGGGEFVAAGPQADFFDAGAVDRNLLAVDGDLDAGVAGFNHERSFTRGNADDGRS